MYAKLVVDISTFAVDELYTYKIPPLFLEHIHIGSRVFVDFGFQKTLAYVLEIVEEADFTGNIKEILEVIDFENGLTPEQIELAKTLSHDLILPLAATLDLMYPSFMQTKYSKKINILNYEALDAELALVFAGKNNFVLTKDLLKYYSKIKKEIELGNIEIKTNLYTYGRRSLEKYYYLIDHGFIGASANEEALVNYLKRLPDARGNELKENLGISDYVIKKLTNSGVIGYNEKLPEREHLEKHIEYRFNDTTSFSMARGKYAKVTGKPYILHTDDYKYRDEFLLSIIMDEVKMAKTSMILVPTVLDAIRLTSYLEKNSNKRILSFYSKLNNSEYYLNYNDLINKNVDVVVTTQSGVFLPLEDIGLIAVIDSPKRDYINPRTPKFDAIEILKQRAKYNNAKILYATSAPSVIDYYEYYNNRYTLISNITKEHTSKDISLVNMAEEYTRKIVSEKLENKIKENFSNKELTVLILNNLTYNQVVFCSECNKILTCPSCNVGLNYSKKKNVYSCYSCNYSVVSPKCDCGSTKFNHYGYGLEFLKEELLRINSDFKIAQVDSETLDKEADYYEFIKAVNDKDIDIIIGTYQLTNYLDFDIKLFGLMNIDFLLNKNDYRSSEEVMQIISKLRANKDVEILIQGYNLTHYSILDAISGNYDDFYSREIKLREDYLYPPFNMISRLLIVGEYKQMYYFANYFKKIFRRFTQASVLGPVYINRIKGIQLIIKYNDYDRLKMIIDEVKKKFKDSKLITTFERYPLSFN